jgi:polyisoprenoid-binding protein YceI
VTARSEGRSRIYLLLAGAVAVAVLAAGAYGAWYVFLRPGGPAAVGETQVALPSSSAAASADSSSAASSDPAADGGIAGAWTVDTSIGSFSDFSGSFVGYRVQEELAGIGGQTAVGRTPDVSGSLTIEGTTVTEVQVTADLSTLQSDDDRRDGQLQRQALETNSFPTATFELTAPIALPDNAASGEGFLVTATGDLTLHGVTREVQVSIEARLESGVIVLTGSIEIVFADYQIDPPSSFAVLSVDDRGVMELQLFLGRS